MDRDTIVALSTPPGESGIAVIRMSGPGAVEILEAMTPGAGRWPPRKLHKCTLRAIDGTPLDEAMAVVMKAPSSYTGEDMVEIYCHGGYQVIADIVDDIVKRGARSAGHGEFTKRAYVNGRMDLAQAEAVADLIAAETRLQRIVALEQLEGKLSKVLGGIERSLLELLSLVEVSIDFSEEDIPLFDAGEAAERLRGIGDELDELLASEPTGEKLRHGIRVTIIGPRNAGKSSIYNALLGEERAIVSSIPGTTRDILRERIHIGGFTYYLEDTAGLAETGCEIEAKGISLGREAAKRAEVIMFVIDGSTDLTADVERELRALEPKSVVLVVNKKDLGFRVDPGELSRIFPEHHVVEVSALTGEGLDRIRDLLFELTAKRGASGIAGGRIVINARQGESLRQARMAVGRAVEALENGSPSEIISMEIKQAIDCCGEVTGRSVAEDLLDTIFSRFCIGK